MYSFNITILGEGHPLSPGWQGPGRYFNPPSPCGEGPCNEYLQAGFSYFNPPSPCGEGPREGNGMAKCYVFQSTLPVWGGTRSGRITNAVRVISIHPPRVGRDGPGTLMPDFPHDFNPPSPCGEGRSQGCRNDHKSVISIHPPRVGRD